MFMRELMACVWKGEAPFARGVLYLPLLALACVYRAVLAVRELCYATQLFRVDRAPVPVISVGNLSLGGTGKTPVVERLAGMLKERGFRPGIVTLGYGKAKKGVFAVDRNSDTAVGAGDEPLMLARRTGLPVLVGKKRIEGIRRGVGDFGIDLAVLDDGAQVRSVRKDVEIVVLDGSAPGAALHLFPLGFLREPLEMAKKADIILVGKGEPDSRVRGWAAGVPVFRVRYRPLHLCRLSDRATVDYRSMRGKRVLAFSGLGDNRSFFGLLRDIGADVVETLEFPDHYRYRAADLARIESFHNVEMAVTTEKDAVRIEGMETGGNILYLCIEAEFDAPEALIGRICEKVRER
jgi:tetraacyldisaccharide 4'-kinase